jgi:hypothetical protein
VFSADQERKRNAARNFGRGDGQGLSRVSQRCVVDVLWREQGVSIAMFYKKHSRWVEGLVSAAKTVGAGAGALVYA